MMYRWWCIDDDDDDDDQNLDQKTIRILLLNHTRILSKTSIICPGGRGSIRIITSTQYCGGDRIFHVTSYPCQYCGGTVSSIFTSYPILRGEIFIFHASHVLSTVSTSNNTISHVYNTWILSTVDITVPPQCHVYNTWTYLPPAILRWVTQQIDSYPCQSRQRNVAGRGQLHSCHKPYNGQL